MDRHSARGKGRVRRALAPALAVALVGALVTGCVSVAEFRKLEYEVNRLKARTSPTAEGGARVADVATDVDDLRQALAELRGRVEEAEHQATTALEEARAARREAAVGAAPGAPGAAAVPGVGEDPSSAGEGAAGGSDELRSYREAYNAWRADDNQGCIDRFRQFLQTYPSSEYADDAAYWMADCYFKQGDYQTAILRFDDVAGRYPKSDKAAEALYRQGEALLRLGPRYGKAAEKAFERVVKEYPESARAEEARRQLEALGAG